VSRVRVYESVVTKRLRGVRWLRRWIIIGVRRCAPYRPIRRNLSRSMHPARYGFFYAFIGDD